VIDSQALAFMRMMQSISGFSERMFCARRLLQLIAGGAIEMPDSLRSRGEEAGCKEQEY
jgi:hypothetical protein